MHVDVFVYMCFLFQYAINVIYFAKIFTYVGKIFTKRFFVNKPCNIFGFVIYNVSSILPYVKFRKVSIARLFCCFFKRCILNDRR